MFPATISIDFGASTTKVAFRANCDPHTIGEYNIGAQMFAVDSSILIPTLAIETGRSDQPWFFGKEAERLTPTPEMKVYRNWKAGLLQEDNGQETARSKIVAHFFFRWLRKKLLEANALPGKPSIRILLPAFDNFEALNQVVLECMRSAGWDENIEFGNEPRANALGLLTEGRNVYAKGLKSESVDFGKTFGLSNPYIQSARKVALSNSLNRTFRMAIVDIGAFTTDIAILEFNLVDSTDDGMYGCAQYSVPVGAFQGIELPLFGHLKDQHGFDSEKTSGSLLEEIKKKVLAGSNYQYRGIELGDSFDQEEVDTILENFIGEIWEHIGDIIRDEKPSNTYLTGGAANISRVYNILRRYIEHLQVAGKSDRNRERNYSNTYLVDWRSDGDAGLRRIATALGGSSFLYSDEISTAPTEELPPEVVDAPDERPCSCRGMNPGCYRCGGSGYLEVRR